MKTTDRVNASKTMPNNTIPEVISHQSVTLLVDDWPGSTQERLVD